MGDQFRPLFHYAGLRSLSSCDYILVGPRRDRLIKGLRDGPGNPGRKTLLPGMLAGVAAGVNPIRLAQRAEAVEAGIEMSRITIP